MEEEVKTQNKHKAMHINTRIHRNLELKKMYVGKLHQLNVPFSR